MQSASRWLAANKSWVSPLLFLGGAIALVLAWQVHPAPTAVIVEVPCDARYVGPLQAVIGARGISGGVVGVGDGIECSSGYAVFSRALNLGERDLEKIRASGSPYRVGLHEGSVVTISGNKGSVIAYEDYVTRAADMRNRLLAAAIGTFLFAAGILFLRDRKDPAGAG